MEAVDKINAEYRENPDQGLIQSRGNAYLNQQFPRLDYVKKATIVRAPAPSRRRSSLLCHRRKLRFEEEEAVAAVWPERWSRHSCDN